MAEEMAGDDSSVAEEHLAPLLSEPRFRRFALAKSLQMTAQNALIYGLFISFITEQSSYVAGSAFVLASVLPSVFLSVPGGLFSDRMPKKPVLLVVLTIRVLLTWQFIDADLSLERVIALTFLVWTVYQFFTPAENAAVVAVAHPNKIAAALAILEALSLGSQIVGAGIVAPLAIDLAGRDGLFVIVIALLISSGVFYATVTNLTPLTSEQQTQRLGWWSAIPTGYRVLRGDCVLLQVTILRVLTDTSMLMVLVAAPKFIEDALHSSPDKACLHWEPGRNWPGPRAYFDSPINPPFQAPLVDACRLFAFHRRAPMPHVHRVSQRPTVELAWLVGRSKVDRGTLIGNRRSDRHPSFRRLRSKHRPGGQPRRGLSTRQARVNWSGTGHPGGIRQHHSSDADDSRWSSARPA